MARRSKVQIRETYSIKLGEDLVAKLSDEQIAILSKYYNSLDAKETSEVDSKIIQGSNDTVLHEMARDMVDEEEEEDIPEGLDDLLGSIQDEPAEETPEPKVTTVKASAIVPSKFFGEDKYAKYRDELVADGTIEGEQLTSEERKEGFKTRNDSDKFSRFVENFLNRKKESDNEETKTLDGRGGALVVPKQPKINVDPVEEESKSNFDDILKGIDSILEVIKKDQKFEEKQANKERKKEERDRRSVRESKLEKKDNVLLKTAKKVLAPVKSIFDKIIEFFATIFLGRALVKLLDWFGDEKNGKKIQSIIRFLGDWWPALLGGYLIFGTGLGSLISGITTSLLLFTPKILSLLANPVVAGAGLLLAGAAIPAISPQTVEDSADEQANESVEEQGKDKTIADLKAQNENRNPLQTFSDFITGAGAEREEQIQRLETGKEKSYGFSGEIKDPPKQMKGGGLVSNDSSILAMNNGGVVKKQDNNSFNMFNPMSWFSGDAQKATKGELGKVSNDTLAGKLYNRRKKQEEAMKMLRGYKGGGEVKDGNSFNMFNPMSWFSGDAQKATTGELGEVSNDTLAGKLYNRRKQQEEMMQKMRGYEEGGKVTGKTGIDKVPAMLTNGEFVMSAGAVQKYGLDTMMSMNAAGGGTNKPKIMEGMMYANGGAPVGEIDFDPVSYRQGMISSKHIENPGDTGETYVLGYTRTPDGDVVVKQMNRVVDKKLLGVFGSDKLTGVSPESDKWNLVLNSANTKKELSTITSYDSGSPVETPPKSIATDPKATVAYAHNQSYQTFKNHMLDEGHDELFAEHAGASAASVGAKLGEDGSYLPNSEKGYKELENVNVATPKKREAAAANEKNKPMTLVEMLTNAINSMAGIGSMLGGGKDGKKEDTREYSQANLQGAKLGDGYGSEGQKIAGDLGTFMKQRKASLPVMGSIHRHPKHLPWGKSGHSANSYHYEGRALDIGGWAPSNPKNVGTDEQAPVLRSLIDYNKKNKVDPVELIHGSPSYKNYGSYREYPDSHSNHVHVAYNKGGTVIKKPAKLTVPEITPLEKQKPKVTIVDGGTKSSAPKRSPSGNKIPDFNASSASRAKANLLGIIDY